MFYVYLSVCPLLESKGYKERDYVSCTYLVSSVLCPESGLNSCLLSGEAKSLKEKLTLAGLVHEPIYGAVQKYHCSSQQHLKKLDD